MKIDLVVTCQHCWRTFLREHTRGPEPRFCSAACRQAAHRKASGRVTRGDLGDAIEQYLANKISITQLAFVKDRWIAQGRPR